MKLYNFVGGKQNGRLISELDAQGLHYIIGNGYSEDWSEERETCEFVPREELDNEFKFKGYLGPMWDGYRFLVDGEWKYDFECSEEEKETCPEAYVLRYETQETYDALSR